MRRHHHKHRRAVAKPKTDQRPKPPRPTPASNITKPTLSAAVAPEPGSDGWSSLRLVLGVSLGLLLLLIAAAVAPARALPYPLFELLDHRREAVLFAALIVGLGILVGLVVVAAT